MMNNLWIRLGLLLCLFVLPISSAVGQDHIPDEKLAMAAALNFLELTDQGDFEGCWDSASELFRKNVDKQTWLQDIAHMRPQYGENRSRTLQFIKPVTPPTAFNQQPALFLIFRSVFTQKAIAEMVTMSKDSDKLWRVAGYSVQ